MFRMNVFIEATGPMALWVFILIHKGKIAVNGNDDDGIYFTVKLQFQ